MASLTALDVERAKSRAARWELLDDKVKGLRVVIQPSGSKSFAVRYSAGGGHHKMTLGQFPRMSLSDARAAALAAMSAVELGTDPAEAKRAAAAAVAALSPDAINAASFAAHADKYEVMHVSTKRLSTVLYVKRELDAAKELLGKRALILIRYDDVLPLLDAAMKSGPHAWNTRRKVLTAFFNWCKNDRRSIKVSPIDGLKKKGKDDGVKPRERSLSDVELKAVWNAADKLGDRYGALVKLLILTGCRRNEIAKLEWSEVKADFILLSPERTKTDEWFRIDLTPAMHKILDALPRQGTYVLGNGTPMSANDYAKSRIDEALGPVLNQSWVFHDLRRSFRTGLARLGVQPQVAEKCLNHKLSGILKVYDVHPYTEEKKAAWELWSSHIETLTAAPGFIAAHAAPAVAPV